MGRCHPIYPIGYTKPMLFLRPLLCLLFIVLAPGSLARAATQFDVTVGFANRVVDNTFTPVRVHIQHTGLAIEGKLVLAQTVSTPWRGVFTETLNQPFKLGQRANKVFTVYFPLNSTTYPLEARLEDRSGQIIARHTLDLRDADAGQRLVLALSETGFPGELPSGETVLSLQSEQLPDNVAGFESIRRLYLGRLNLATLGRARQQALFQWIMLGGDLVVLGGNNWYIQDTPLLRPWLPLVPEGVEEVDYAFGDTTPTVSGALRGSVLFSSAKNRPLILRRSLGRGYVWFTTIDPLAHPPFAAFWEALKQPPFQDGMSFPQLAQNTFLQQPLSFPSRVLVGVVLMAFIGGVAVFSWISLRKPWAGATLFGWVLASAIGVVVLLAQPRFSQPLTAAEYGVETILSDGTAYRQTWLGLYAQRKEAIQIVFPASASVRQQLPDNRGNHLYDLNYLIDTGTRITFSTQPQQIRTLLSNEPASPSLLWHPAPDGIVEVESTLELEQTWLLHGGKLYALGRLQPGRPRRFHLESLVELSVEDLPPAVAALWSWSIDRRQSGSFVGGWHGQGRAVFQMPAFKHTYHVVVAQGGL